MLTTLVLAGALLATPQADKWDIKAGMAPKVSSSYDLVINVMVNGTPQAATGKLLIDRKDVAQGKPPAATYSMKDVLLDSGQNVPDQTWNLTLDPSGGIVDTDSDAGADAVRTFLIPWTFIYPDKPVGVGDTWSDTIKAGDAKNDQSFVINMKADSMDKIDGADALKVTEDLTQAGDGGMKSTANWWLDKNGKILKFDIKTSNWVVYLMGAQPFDATFTGTPTKP